jgi:hypothetical protein
VLREGTHRGAALSSRSSALRRQNVAGFINDEGAIPSMCSGTTVPIIGSVGATHFKNQ